MLRNVIYYFLCLLECYFIHPLRCLVNYRPHLECSKYECWIHKCPSYQRLSAAFFICVFIWTSYLSQWRWKISEMLWGILNCRKWYLKLTGLQNQKRSVFIVHSPVKIAKFEMCLCSHLLLAAQIALDIPIIVHLIQNNEYGCRSLSFTPWE